MKLITFIPVLIAHAVVTSKSMPVLLGDYLTLTCSVYNSNETIFYWFLNDTILSGQSTNTYVISGVQLSDLGYYKRRNNPDYRLSGSFRVYCESSKYCNFILCPQCNLVELLIINVTRVDCG